MWPFFNPTMHRGSHISSSQMVYAGCVFVAGIHPSGTWTTGSFRSVRWNACVHRLDLGLYSHPKEFWGNGVRTHVNPKGKIPSTWKILPRGGSNPWCCIKQDSTPNTLPMSYSSPQVWANMAKTFACNVIMFNTVFAVQDKWTDGQLAGRPDEHDWLHRSIWYSYRSISGTIITQVFKQAKNTLEQLQKQTSSQTKISNNCIKQKNRWTNMHYYTDLNLF